MNPGQQNQTDQTANFFWLLVIICLAGLAIWFFSKQYVVIPFFWLRSHEIDVLRYLATWWTPVAQTFHLPVPDVAHLNVLQNYIDKSNPTKVTWREFTLINVAIGDWTRYPVIVILLILATFMFFQYGTALFHNLYTMKTLRIIDQPEWPQITPVLSLDLIKEDISTGPWAMAKLPIEFCREHDLLLLKTVNKKQVWTLKQKTAFRAFVVQLGSLWVSVDALPIHLQALVVIFMARVTGQRPLAKKLLCQIALSTVTGKLDFTGVAEHLDTFRGHKFIKWLEKRHAYVTTFMATLLEISRSDGVLASADFLWLKPVDRRMWYVLNNVGRRAATVEIAGVFSHWKAEKKVGRALKTPMIKNAVDALDESLQNILYIAEEDRWHTTNAD